MATKQKPDFVETKVVQAACPQCRQLSIRDGYACWVCGWRNPQYAHQVEKWTTGRIVMTVVLSLFGAIAVATATVVAFFAVCTAVLITA